MSRKNDAVEKTKRGAAGMASATKGRARVIPSKNFLKKEPIVEKETFINKWADALRSGRYEQGQQFLRTIENKYCCLGVACDLLNVPWDNLDIIVLTTKAYKVDGNHSTLSDRLMREAGIDNEIHDTLWRMNDLQKNTFDEIADYLESINEERS